MSPIGNRRYKTPAYDWIPYAGWVKHGVWKWFIGTHIVSFPEVGTEWRAASKNKVLVVGRRGQQLGFLQGRSLFKNGEND